MPSRSSVLPTEASAPCLQIALFGGLRLGMGEKSVTSVNTPRLQALLAYLVLHRDRPILRQQLAFQLWPDSSERQARTNLRKLFFQLQRTLPNANRFLLADSQTLGWNAQAAFTLDVAEVQQQVTHLQREPLDPVALRRVVELYQGELLPSCYDDWIMPIRQELHQTVMAALERLLTLLEKQRAYRTGIEYARRLLAFDPLEEKSYQRLMRLHALDGDYGGALRIYQDCVAVLQRELDVAPDPATQALYERLRRRDTTLAANTNQELQSTAQLPLIGRQREWERLQSVWRQVGRGQPHFVCIGGEAGIGKTRLAEELLQWASQQGFLTARTRSYQTQGALAYAPITELLRHPTLAPQLTKLSEQAMSEIARLLPELLDKRPGLPPPQPMSESWQRQRFFDAVARAVLTEAQPLLLLFDDLHWFDPESLSWLNYLLHFASQAPLLVVGTSRSEEVSNDHPLMALQRGLRREDLITEIELTPLGRGETNALADVVATHTLTDAERQQIYVASEGNPLFIVETIRAGAEQATTAPSPGQPDGVASATGSQQQILPPKIYAVLQARLSQLSPQAQKLVSLAAVIGRSFTFAVLSAAACEDEEVIVTGLDELWARRLIREQGSAGYDFSHDRIRDVAYCELSRARRRQLHRRVAEALEAVYASSVDEISGQLAEHYEQSGIYEKTIHYLQRAGERATRQFANTSAIKYFTHALNLIPLDNHALRFPLLLSRVRIYNHQGRRTEEKHDLEALQTIVRGLDGNLEAAKRQQGELALQVAAFGQGISNNDMARVAAQEAAELAEQCGANDLGAQAYFLWAIADFWDDAYFVHARSKLEKALTLARTAGVYKTVAEALSFLSIYSLYTGGSLYQIDAYGKEALTTYQRLGDRAGEAVALGMLAYVISTQREGNYDLGIHYCEQALQIASEISGWDANRLAVGMLGFLWYCQGDYARARPYLERQLVITQQAQN